MRSASLRAFITSTTVLVALASYVAAGPHAHHRSTSITGPGFNRDDNRMGKDERNDFLTKDNNPSQRPVLVPSATPVVRPTPNAIPSATLGGTRTNPSQGGAAIGPINDDPSSMVTPKTQIPSATPGGARSSVSPIPTPPLGSR